MNTMTFDKKAENKEFLKLLFVTVLPLLIQSLFMQSINLIDQLMVSRLGDEAIAAIGASNKLLSIYNSFLYGTCSGSAMFLAQYWGNKDVKGFQRVLGIAMTATVTMGTIISVLVLAVPRQLISIFADDALVIEYGIDYMKTVVLAYFLMGIVFPLNFALRSMNKVKVTMISTITSVLLNCAANYVFIFGKFGFPEMGVKGAALGTVVTRVVEIIILFTYFIVSKNPVLRNIRNLFNYQKSYIVNFVSKAVPLIGNEMMWSLGTTIYFIIYGRTGKEALAAMSIMQTLQMLAKIFSGGFCGSASIIIGNEIGKGDVDRVQRFCKKFHVAAFIVGVISCLGVIALINPVQKAYDIAGTQTGEYVKQCMYILSIYIIMNACNSINVEGIFRSGGDVAYVTLMDMGSIWLIGMPFTLITGLVLKCDIAVIYLAYIVLEIYKLPLGHIRFKSGKWLHKLYDEDKKDDTGEKDMLPV